MHVCVNNEPGHKLAKLLDNTRGGSTHFKTEGRGRSNAVEFFVSWDCFDAHLHLPYVFVKVVNKIIIAKITC